jgi:hypothetical protein
LEEWSFKACYINTKD